MRHSRVTRVREPIGWLAWLWESVVLGTVLLMLAFLVPLALLLAE